MRRHEAERSSARIGGGGAPGRVLFVSTVSDLVGGAERSLVELACALEPLGWRPALAVWRPGPLADAFRKRDSEVFIRSVRGRQPGSPLGGATLRFPALGPLTRAAVGVSIALRPLGREVAWLRSVIEEGAFKLVHSNCDLSIPIASLAARQAGVPFVAHVRDHWRHWFHPRILAHLRRADMVLVASRDMVRRLRTHGLDSRLVYNPVAGDRLARTLAPGEREDWRSELGVDGTFAVAIVGRLDPQKRVELALQALHALRAVRTPVTLLIAGQGPAPYEQRLRRLWEGQHGDTPSDRPHGVKWLGHRTDVAEWLPTLDALIMPSRAEPFGRAIVEGMLAGLPVIATTDGAGPELLEGGRTGLLVPADDVAAMTDAIARLVDGAELRRALGSAARVEALKRFSPLASAATVADLYQQLLNDSRRVS